MRKRQIIPTNKNAHITSRVDRTGKSRTETTRRDLDTVNMAVSTNETQNNTNLFIDFPGFEGSIQLNGREARSLYRLLRKHYGFTGKSRKA